MNYILAPSILAADVSCLGDQIKSAADAGAKYLHIDVMDGTFVPNISFGLPVVRGLRKFSDLFFDVHLMITDPGKYVRDFAQAGADGITVHAEACGDGLYDVITQILGYGAKPAVAIRPDTDIEVVFDVLERISMVLVMTVYPGYGGQKIITDTFDKISALRDVIKKRGLSVDIEVDGGITLDNVEDIKKKGANVFVAGTGVFAGDIEDNVGRFLKVL